MAGKTGAAAQATGGGDGGEVGEDELRRRDAAEVGDAAAEVACRLRPGPRGGRRGQGEEAEQSSSAKARLRRGRRRRPGARSELADGGENRACRRRGPSSRTGGRERRCGSGRRGERRCGGRGGAARRLRPEGERRERPERSDASGESPVGCREEKDGRGERARVQGPRPCRPVLMP